MFGPLADGMVIHASTLPRLIRDTAISAHQFGIHFIHNRPLPMMTRLHAIKAAIFRQYQPLSLASFYEKFVFPQ